MSGGAFDPIPILRLLHRHQVAFVIVGGVAGYLHGSDIVTNDLDICFARDVENTRRLAAALKEMHARLRGFPEDPPYAVDEHALRLGETFTFETDYGLFDCLGNPAGTAGFLALQANAETMSLDGRSVLVADIDDLIRMKEAAGRAKDLFAVEVLRVIKQLRERE
jgi:hypothetical protein